MTKMKNKITKIIISCVLVLSAVGGLATAFLLNYNSYVPESVEVIENDEQTFLLAKANSNYKGYRFVFSQGGKEISLESENNVISLSDCLEKGVKLGERYKVKFCYVSKTKGNNSRYSKEILWSVQVGLKTPVISYDEAENELRWEAIDNADYYVVYYNLENLSSTQVTECKFSLSEIPVGERNFYIVAMSSKSYIRPSKSSNVVYQLVTRQMQGFYDMTFDESNKTLTMSSTESVNKIALFVGENEYECSKFTKIKTSNVYTYSIDISLVYKKNERIGAKPVSLDIYNVYTGEITYAS